MTAWEAIKKEATANERPGTTGYQVELIRAGKIFIAILPYLKDRKRAEAAYNDDVEVTAALMAYGILKEIGLQK